MSKSKLILILLSILWIPIIGNTQVIQFVNKEAAFDRESGNNFGRQVAISGSYAIAGEPYSKNDSLGNGPSLVGAGGSYLVEQNGAGNWVEVERLTASDRAMDDRFGWAVSISGNIAVVGAYLEDEDENGLNTMLGSGSVYIFERNGVGDWNQIQKIVASDRAIGDRFGGSVSISGDYIVVGANGQDGNEFGMNPLSDAGAAYIFERNGSGSWIEVQKIVASFRDVGDFFGTSVALSDNYLVVGSDRDDDNLIGGNNMSNAGSAFVFERNAGNWVLVDKLIGSDRGPDDKFGAFVAISNGYLVVGAWQEDHDLTGGNFMSNSGSAYVFERNISGDWLEVTKLVASDRSSGDSFGYGVSISGSRI